MKSALPEGNVGNPAARLDPHALLTAQEKADELRVSLATLYRWRREGRGPKWIRIPGSRLIRYRPGV
jgi:hypothetical protein